MLNLTDFVKGVKKVGKVLQKKSFTIKEFEKSLKVYSEKKNISNSVIFFTKNRLDLY